MGLVAKAEQDPVRDRALGEAAAQERQRRHPDPAADQDRTGGAGAADLARLGEGVAERPGDPDLLPLLERAEPAGAGADLVDQEVEADPGGAPGRSRRPRLPAAG